ncbi:glucose-6-phosphate isomerase [Terasakiella brassicae]|uniref:Glucose-6-phosphate isomerase n=1 Tax=Terasakiella brassicae TaxID=1634917 RepID=A0A917FCL7_9PROT|nr:glucose-6-phosphate isomerase [Terasakiella brassicae]GGF68342.1 glucose-6-phosphate isomerase [Terasakiella brassicae]
MSALTDSPAWQALLDHHQEIKDVHMRDLFKKDRGRFERFSERSSGLLLDYSKNRITEKTMGLLGDLARSCGVEEARDRMFNGAHINTTEDRAVYHVALRNRSDRAMIVDGHDVMPEVRAVLEKMRHFCDDVREGRWRGVTGKRIRTIVNIGIGGSDLGVIMALQALRSYQSDDLTPRFISNVDSSHLVETLRGLDAETTLFIVSSKSFTTQETLLNATSARTWLIKKLGTDAVRHHFVAVSTNEEKVCDFGIDTDYMFPFWDWVGGRYSTWSAIGLAIALVLGMDKFEEMLEGAFAMDEHFRTSPIEHNIPIIMAMLGVWYANFFGWSTHAVLPYDQYLTRFPQYLQQVDMESNGKRVDLQGRPVDYQTGPIVFGHAGTNAQHSFFQLLHQGKWDVSMDFIGVANNHHPLRDHQTILLSNFLGQTKALMWGKTEKEVRAQLKKKGVSAERIDQLAPHMTFPGNKPTNSLVLPLITPFTIGQLLALYEHKIFVQGVVWNINSFDQWGVQLGKELARDLAPQITGEAPIMGNDCSTQGLLKYMKLLKKEYD